MHPEEIKDLNVTLHLSINANLNAIGVLYDRLHRIDRKYMHVETFPQEWSEIHIMKSLQFLTNSNEILFSQLDRLTSLLSDEDAARADILTKPLKKCRDRLEKLVKKIERKMRMTDSW